jgi:DNA repair protein RecN (Recombination protein N)
LIKALHIKNFAIMGDIEVEFSDGLNVLTGETGTGKSIVVDAISMLLGERASIHKVRSGSDRAVIEGLFDIGSAPEKLAVRLEEMGVDLDDSALILRRDIYASGSSRCYIDGGMTSSQTLAEIGEYLCDIHGQHQHQTLLRRGSQLDLLDGYSGAMILREGVGELFRELRGVEKELEVLKKGSEERERKKGNLGYAIEEIDKAALKQGEEEELEREIQVMQNFQHLHMITGQTLERLSGEEGSIIGKLGISMKELDELTHIDSTLSGDVEKIRNCYFQLEEAAGGLRKYREKLFFDPSLLEEKLERKDLLRRLKSKYGASITEVLKYREKAVAELESIESGSTRIEELRTRQTSVMAELKERAGELTELRRNRAGQLENEVMGGLKELGMEKASFQIGFDEIVEGEIGSLGAEGISFFISTNPGESKRPLSEVVSGGELSRIMLVLRALQASRDHILTLIFDEVDSGIGGHVAHAVGERLLEVSRGRQVFVITHLPQIAARARHHFSVQKTTRKERAEVSISELDDDGKINEIIRMLGGDVKSDASRRHARELLSVAH